MSKIDDFFITPLEAHFESTPTEGGRETILADLDKFTPDELHEAAEWLKRNRQPTKTFPSPKECIKAVTTVAGFRKRLGSNISVAVTAETYAACAETFNAGKKEVPIIKKGTPQWDEWRDYWEWLGARHLIFWTEERNSWTVPTAFPGQFDPRYSPAKRLGYSVGDRDGSEDAA